jgi:hypothetical protein
MSWLSPLRRWSAPASLKPGTFRPRVEQLEQRTLPASTITAAFGAGPGGGPVVTVVFDDNSRFSFLAFPPNFNGGVSAILGRVNGTAVPDVIVGTGRGLPEVEVFNGQQLLAGNVVPMANFFAFSTAFTSGVTLAAGRVNGTSHADVIVALGAGGPPEVSVFDGAALASGRVVATATFSAFDPRFLGGVSLGVGSVNGSTHDDIVVGAGPGGGPEVRVIDGAQLAQGKAVATADFFALPSNFTGGVTVAVGPVNGTNHDDVVVGARAGAGPQVTVFGGAQLARGQVTPTASFFAFDPRFTGGVTLAVGNVDGTTHADVIVGAGPGGGPQVGVFDGASLAAGQVVQTANIMALPAGFRGGVQVLVARNPGGRATLVVVAGPGGGPQVIFFNSAFFPFVSFFAFAPFFVGGVDLGFDFFDFGGCGCNGVGVPFGTAGEPAVATGGFTGFTNGGFSSGGFSGGGFSGGSGGSGGGSGGSLHAAGGGVGGVGAKGQGGGLYLGVGMLSLSDGTFTPSTANTSNSDPLAEASRLLSGEELRMVAAEAISWWDAAGITPAQDQRLRQATILVTPLGTDLLGHTVGNQISLSPTAAGFGWFVDASIPMHAGVPAPTTAGHMDLATVLAHEMGLVLGLNETPARPDDIMAPFLSAGVRRRPTAFDLDTFFSHSASVGQGL